MPIINDLDNKKTVDSETGVFLRFVDSRAQDSYRVFNLVDGDHVIPFNVQYETNHGNKPAVYTYKKLWVHEQFNNKQAFESFLKTITEFLLVFQWMHGPGDGTVVFKADFERPIHVNIEGQGYTYV